MSNSPNTATITTTTTTTITEAKKEARNEFVRAVGKTVDQLITEYGCSRDRATALVLHEITESPPHFDHEMAFVKQHYRLSHLQASQALAVSAAFKKLIQDESLSHEDAVRRLTEKLCKASFSFVGDTAHPISGTPAAAAPVTAAPVRKASEISFPQFITQQQKLPAKAKSPVKKTRSSTGFVAAAKPLGKVAKAARKRSIDEIGAASNGNKQPPEEKEPIVEKPQQRPRADSVTEEVAAKLQNQEPPVSNNGNTSSASNNNNAEKPAPTVVTRSKRTRGAASGLDEAVEAGSAVKRSRQATE